MKENCNYRIEEINLWVIILKPSFNLNDSATRFDSNRENQSIFSFYLHFFRNGPRGKMKYKFKAKKKNTEGKVW